MCGVLRKSTKYYKIGVVFEALSMRRWRPKRRPASNSAGTVALAERERFKSAIIAILGYFLGYFLGYHFFSFRRNRLKN